MPAVRGRTITTMGGFLQPVGLSGSSPAAPQTIALVSLEESAALDSLRDTPIALASLGQLAMAISSREVTA